MSEGWKEGYRRAMLSYVAKNGTSVEPGGGNYYGYIDHNWREVREHVMSCGIDASATVEEVSWDEFAGTFATSSDYHKHGVDVKGKCKCGKMDLHLRVEAGVGEILLGILEEE